jgi:NAD(P)-dependent dehydrogenase (short-subunit alcohol dehydrogenase family)
MLNGQKVVIIGGSSGIGLATARSAVESGAHVVIASRSQEKIEQAVLEIGGTVESHVLDVTNEEDVKNFFQKVGAFDHLVLTAGSGVAGAFLDLDVAVAKQAFETKFWGQYTAAKYGAPHLKAEGSITLVSGALSQKPMAGLSTLAVINSAVETLSKALAIELSPIRVNAVSPGTVKTPAYGWMNAEQQQAYYAAIAESLPAKRVGEPDDLAASILYLMQNRFTTGTVLEVNGGHALA